MRRRFVQINGELVEVSLDAPSASRSGGQSGDSALWNDRLYQDGNDPRFKSRAAHRAFMKRHGLTTADDYSEQWRKDEARRIAFRRGDPDPARRRSIEAAIHKLNNRR